MSIKLALVLAEPLLLCICVCMHLSTRTAANSNSGCSALTSCTTSSSSCSVALQEVLRSSPSLNNSSSTSSTGSVGLLHESVMSTPPGMSRSGQVLPRLRLTAQMSPQISRSGSLCWDPGAPLTLIQAHGPPCTSPQQASRRFWRESRQRKHTPQEKAPSLQTATIYMSTMR